MRRIREVTAQEENFRMEPVPGTQVEIAKRDPVEPEPVGTVLLVPVRVVGYDPDSDGSLMARLEVLGLDDAVEPDDIDPVYQGPLDDARRYSELLTHWGLYPNTGIVVTPAELQGLLDSIASGET